MGRSENVHELISPCDARRREKVGALYSAVSGLLVIISRAYPGFLSPAHGHPCTSILQTDNTIDQNDTMFCHA